MLLWLPQDASIKLQNIHHMSRRKAKLEAKESRGRETSSHPDGMEKSHLAIPFDFFSRRHMNSIQTMVVRMGPWIRHPWNFIPHGYAEGPSSWRARIIGTCVFSSIYNVKFPSGPCSMIRSLEYL